MGSNKKYLSKFVKGSSYDSKESKKDGGLKVIDDYDIYDDSVDVYLERSENERKQLEMHAWILEHGYDVRDEFGIEYDKYGNFPINKVEEYVKGICHYIIENEVEDIIDTYLLGVEFYCLPYDRILRYTPQKIRHYIMSYYGKNQSVLDL